MFGNGSSGLKYIYPSESFDIPPIYEEGWGGDRSKGSRDLSEIVPRYLEAISRYISEALGGITEARDWIEGYSGMSRSPTCLP